MSINNSLTQRATREAILTAGTTVELRTPLLAQMRDNRRPPALSDEGFDVRSTVGVDCRILSPDSGDRENFYVWVEFDPSQVLLATADLTGLEITDSTGTITFSMSTTGSPWVSFSAFMAAMVAAAEAELISQSLGGEAIALDLDEDGVAETLQIRLDPPAMDGPWRMRSVDTSDCGDWTLWVVPDEYSARLWFRSGGVFTSAVCPPAIAALASGWALAGDLGEVSSSFDERLALPARTQGWIELYDVTFLPAGLNADPPTLPNALADTVGTPSVAPLVFAMLLPAVSP